MGKNKDKVKKLQLEIDELKKDIYYLVRDKYSDKGVNIELFWIAKFKAEENLNPLDNVYELESVERYLESDLFRVVYKSKYNQVLMTIRLEDIDSLISTGSYAEIQKMFNDGKK